MADIDSILAAGSGPAILTGATAGYHSAEGNRVAEEQNALAKIRPLIPQAVAGDQGAMGQVAQASPSIAGKLAPILARMDANQAAKLKQVVDWTGNAAGTVLNAPAAERAAIYDTAKQAAAAQGLDTKAWPETYNENWVKMQRDHAVGAKAIFEQQEMMRRHLTPGARAAGGGAVEGDIPDGPAPAGFTPAAGPRVSMNTGIAPPDVAANTAVAPAGGPAPQGGPIPSVVAQAPVVTAPAAPNNGQAATAPNPGVASGSAVAEMPMPAQGAAPPGPFKQDGPATVAPAVPDGFQAMGHRDSQGNLVPALIDGKPVFRNPQTGEMRLGDSGGPQAPTAPAGPSASPPGAPAALPPEPGPQIKNGSIIYQDPAMMGGKMQGVRQPNGSYKPSEGPGGTVKYRLPDGTTVFYGPNLKDPGGAQQFEDVTDQGGKIIGQRDKRTNQYHPINQTQGGGDEVDPQLKGADVYAALPPARAAEIKSIVEGDNPIPSANARNQYAQETRKLVFQAAEPGFTDATHKQRMEMKTAMTKGKIGDVLTTQGTLFNHLKELQETAEDLKNTSYPFVNKLGNWVGLNEGDPRVSNMQVVKHRVNEEAEKYFGGSGAVTVSGLQEAQKDINSAQSPEQLEGAVRKLTKLIAGRQSELTSQINRGLQYPKDRQLTADDLLTPEAKASRDAIMSRLSAAQTPNGVGEKLGLSAPPKAERPPIESFQK